jgi:EAL domain-containing protein (putative c-di-GMP-specific phosphodiesterase class I)/ActR/RegA family two-component response regulator
MDPAGATPLESQLVVILDDDVMITEALAEGLERPGRTVITCNDLESAQVIVERLKPSHVVSDVRLSGPFGFEGLDFIRFVLKCSPGTRVVLMTGDAPDALQLEASERGAVGFLRKPFDVADLDSAIDLLSCSVLSSSAADAAVIHMPLFDEIINNESLKAFFQPIVHLTEGHELLGFEALARYNGNSLLKNPEVLFQYATRKQRIEDLEMACVGRSLRAYARLGTPVSLFLNIHPHVLSHGPLIRKLLLRDCERLSIPLDRIVLEITEQGSLNPGPMLFENVDQLRALGVRFAFDDLGVAYSHLPLIDKLHPSFLKVSQEFGTTFERDSTKLKIVLNLQSLARDFGCELILEGIEDVSTADMAARLGIKYGQGFLLGRPSDPASLGS